MSEQPKHPVPIVVDEITKAPGNSLFELRSFMRPGPNLVLKSAQWLNRNRKDWNEGTAASQSSKVYQKLEKKVDSLVDDVSKFVASGTELNNSVKQMAEMYEQNLEATTRDAQDISQSIGKLSKNGTKAFEAVTSNADAATASACAVQDAAAATKEAMDTLNQSLRNVHVVAN
ncbi:uncharacterized protein ColSpa_01920 [Colletotrichum spaethianum]|uniref:Uncharacterized protein n=1 Tax=Colletotrichum spaethianum TaxID=700344 RepID=A0AA37L6W3_9PEZI|nr:uncharacterized protein ColSpa_01920 [Colletotrichum spaethianum]GKT41739.1 hypothetical protein ColSpa_01920 [Colletotrichum spaethianum]